MTVVSGGEVGGLVALLRDRDVARTFSAEEWNQVLAAAEAARLLSRVAIDLERLGLTSGLPSWVRDRLASARIRGEAFARDVRWEVACVRRALGGAGITPVFLKGAAYAAAALPCGVGRVQADIDILVPESSLPATEGALKSAGWTFVSLDAYDERYYREWMHELPPMIHAQRGTVLDVHHRILPRTGRRHPPTDRLLSHSVETGGVSVLSRPHMVLHAAAHLFQDGELDDPLRELLDIADLCAVGADSGSFWTDLTLEAVALELGRPLLYALRYTNRFLHAPVPANVTASLARWSPAPPVLAAMDRMVAAVVARRNPAASQALYIRANWMKMPPLLLTKHLAAKVARAIRLSSRRKH
jgi:hypothetical protein